VDAIDLALWRAGFGTGTIHLLGDADGDHDVDAGDFLVWQRQISNDSSAVGGSGAVPEPATSVLLALAVIQLASRIGYRLSVGRLEGFRPSNAARH